MELQYNMGQGTDKIIMFATVMFCYIKDFSILYFTITGMRNIILLYLEDFVI